MRTRVALLALSILTLTGCFSSDGGTETGNPYTGPHGETYFGARIRDRLCQKLMECNAGLSRNGCTNGINPITTVGAHLGLGPSVSSDGSFENLIVQEVAGVIVASATPAQQCLTDIDALDCSDPSVTAAYSSTASAHPFNNVHLMIPSGSGTCGGVF